MFCGVINVLFAGVALLAPFRPGEVTGADFPAYVPNGTMLFIR